jgi:hypothetical protein
MGFAFRAFRCLALVALAAWSSSAASQQTYFVFTTAPSGPGSLLAAVQAMQNNGQRQTIELNLAPGSVVTLAGDLPQLVGTEVWVVGAAPGIVIDGNGFRIFRYIGQSMLLSNLTLRNGRSTGAGCLGSNASILTRVLDSTFENCRTDGTSGSGSSGGALFVFGPLQVARTRFVGNAAYDGGIANLALGGGALSVTGGSIQIDAASFVDNFTVRTPQPGGGCVDGVGGAVTMDVASGGNASILNTSFTGNSHRCGSPAGSISGQGAALSIFGPTSGTAPTVTIDRSFFGGNRADNGAGIFARAVQLTLNNSSFHDNVGRGAGAVFLTTGFGGAPPPPELRAISSTFWRNGTGLGSFGADLTLNASVIVRQFRNLLFAAPAAGSSCAPQSFNADSGDVVFTTDITCFAFVAGSPITSQFAAGNTFGLQNPAFNGGFVPTMDLGAGSIAIDNGTNAGCPPADARGLSRPYDGDGGGIATCDVGAVEYRPALLFRDGFEN